MLRKLVYHEFEATVRQYLPLYMIMLGLCAFACIAHPLMKLNALLALIPTLLFGLSILAIVCTVVIGMYLPAVRFYKNMLGSEGYLTFTLPVKVNSLINSKLIVSCIWLTVTVLLCIGSTEVLFRCYKDISVLSLIKESMESDFAGDISSFFVQFILCMAISVLTMPVAYYVSIAFGQVLSRNKLLGSIAGYFVISFVVQIIAVAVLLIATLIIGFDNVDSYMNTPEGITAMLVMINVLLVILAVIEYAFTVKLLKKKLNLE